MRIGIDCRTILNSKNSERAGIAHYSYFLVKNIFDIENENKYILFFSFGQSVPKEFLKKNIEIIYFPKKIIPLLSSHYIFAKIIERQKLDLYHSLSGNLPLLLKTPSVITVADLAMYVNPQWFLPKNDFFWRKIIIPWSIKKAKKIIAISENTKKDIIHFFHIREDIIEVIYLGVETKNYSESELDEELKACHLEGKNYFLFIGTLEPRKNIIRIIQAFEELVLGKSFAPNSSPLRGEGASDSYRGKGEGKDNKEEFFLVLAGGLGWKYEDIVWHIEKSQAKSNIIRTGYVSQKTISALLQNALCLVWPSLYEGFGLPVLEAMSFGAPVITANNSSLPEVGGDAVIYVHAENVNEIASAMKNIVQDNSLRTILQKKGRERAKFFDWKKSAQKTIQVYANLHTNDSHDRENR